VQVRNLDDVPNKLDLIASDLKESSREQRMQDIRAPKVWRPIGRAAVRARHVQIVISAHGELLTWAGVSRSLQRVTDLWVDTKNFLRYAPRDQESVVPPYAPQRLSAVRRALSRSRGEAVMTVALLRRAESGYPQIQRDRAQFEVPQLSRELARSPAPTSNRRVPEQEVVVPATFTPSNMKAGVLSSPEYLKTRQYSVWFGTNRQIQGEGFSAKTSGELTLGQCIVHVPRTHAFGSLGSSWPVRIWRAVRGKEDDRVRVTSVVRQSNGEWINGISNELIKWPARTALVIVHGYNVSFDEAARRSAQIGFDLRIDGVTAFFSWPSQGRILPYTWDEESVQVAEEHFVKFLMLLASVTGLTEINILAHSMGNRLLLRTARELLRVCEDARSFLKIGQIILAAADVATAVFEKHTQAYRTLALKQLTTYSCRKDLALRLSHRVHGQRRVGLEPPVFVSEGFESISAAQLDIHGLGHGYYAEAEPLLYDMGELLHDNKPPAQRLRLRRSNAGEYWEFDA
jgi:esterase/lipase superfamily enzyme